MPTIWAISSGLHDNILAMLPLVVATLEYSAQQKWILFWGEDCIMGPRRECRKGRYYLTIVLPNPLNFIAPISEQIGSWIGSWKFSGLFIFNLQCNWLDNSHHTIAMKQYFTLEIGDESWNPTGILTSSVILIQLTKLLKMHFPEVSGDIYIKSCHVMQMGKNKPKRWGLY